ncbi:uncharacterized protein DUF998 [Arthrobacter sp. AG1021]|uniref:DUF998 domain-containing protein n=1 Tax=Arthrobacter sp. AG1021 TaxID=2183908 RepID=UPI000F1A0AB0|nr:DUF998 domain-containing protein [Arthrobacter sp. AG1021]RKS19373.1 uncharacterized protein DUF998 [Arthrobacter sp. AG1021]
MNEIQDPGGGAELRRARIRAAALGAGAAAYSLGILGEAVLGWPLDPRTAMLSELAARDRWHRGLFQWTDMASAGCYLVAACASRPGDSDPRGLLSASLAAFGAATIGDALSPLDYPVSFDDPGSPRRAERPEDSGTSASHGRHYATTALASAASMGLVASYWREFGRQPGASARRRLAAPAVLGLLAASAASLVSPKLHPGTVQRLYTLGFSALCVDFARRDLARSNPASSGPAHAVAPR